MMFYLLYHRAVQWAFFGIILDSTYVQHVVPSLRRQSGHVGHAVSDIVKLLSSECLNQKYLVKEIKSDRSSGGGIEESQRPDNLL